VNYSILGGSLSLGASLSAGQGLRSADGRFELDLQGNGNLAEVSVADGRVLWSSNTAGGGGSFLTLQADMNLVLYTASGRPVWATGTSHPGAAGALFALQTDANLVLYGPTGAAWYNNAAPSRMIAGTVMSFNQTMASPDGRYMVAMQTDGNLVMYSNGRALWASGTGGNPYATVMLQADGNFVIYRADGRPVWATMSGGGAGQLIQQADGNLVLYAPGRVSWCTGTH